MIATIVGVIILIVVVAVVSSPFFPLGRRFKSYYISDGVNELIAKRNRLYEEMRILQLDQKLGNLDYEDYKSIINSHRIEAAKLMEKQNKLEEKDLDEALENEIKAFRESSTSSEDSDPPKGII